MSLSSLKIISKKEKYTEKSYMFLLYSRVYDKNNV